MQSPGMSVRGLAPAASSIAQVPLGARLSWIITRPTANEVLLLLGTQIAGIPSTRMTCASLPIPSGVASAKSAALKQDPARMKVRAIACIFISDRVCCWSELLGEMSMHEIWRNGVSGRRYGWPCCRPSRWKRSASRTRRAALHVMALEWQLRVSVRSRIVFDLYRAPPTVPHFSFFDLFHAFWSFLLAVRQSFGICPRTSLSAYLLYL